MQIRQLRNPSNLFPCSMKLRNEHNCSSRVSKTCHLHCSSLFQSRNRPATLQTADSWQMARRSLNRKEHEKLQNRQRLCSLMMVSGEIKLGGEKTKTNSVPRTDFRWIPAHLSSLLVTAVVPEVDTTVVLLNHFLGSKSNMAAHTVWLSKSDIAPFDLSAIGRQTDTAASHFEVFIEALTLLLNYFSSKNCKICKTSTVTRQDILRFFLI